MGEDVLVYVPVDRDLENYHVGTLLTIQGMRWHSLLQEYAIDKYIPLLPKKIGEAEIEECLQCVGEQINDFFNDFDSYKTVHDRLNEAKALLQDTHKLLTIYNIVRETGAIFLGEYTPKEDLVDLEDKGYILVSKYKLEGC